MPVIVWRQRKYREKGVCENTVLEPTILLIYFSKIHDSVSLNTYVLCEYIVLLPEAKTY